MENTTNLNEMLFIFNKTNTAGQNGTLSYPFPAPTIAAATVGSLGITANIFVIITIAFSSLRGSVFMNLIMSLAICDSMYLMAVLNIQTGLFGQLFISPSLVHCRFTFFLVYVSGIVSSWVTVLISLERYIALYHPFKVHIYCTTRRTYLAILALVILSSTGCIPFFYSCSVSLNDQMPQCDSFGENVKYDIILISLILSLYSFLPFLLITVLNILMMRKIQLQKTFRSRSQQSKEPSSAINSSLIIMMFCVCSIFAVTSFPASILTIVSNSCKFNNVKFCILDPDGWLAELTFMLDDINHGINFFLYCLRGSVFRLAFFHLFKCGQNKSPGHNFHQEMATTENVS